MNERLDRHFRPAPSNNGLHQTRRGGAVASRPVVEARLAGEAGVLATLLEHS